MRCYWILLALLSPKYSLATLLQSVSSTIDTICNNVVFSITLLNKQELLKLINKSRCNDYWLLGENVLASSQRGERYCYTQVAPVLCESKYTPIKPQPNCEHIKSKFMTIVNACTQEGPLERRDCNCAGLNMETLTITDPLVFCKLGFVSSDGDVRVSFKHNEVDDCQALAESYNHCQNMGNAFNHPRFCVDGGFQGYCNSRIQRIHDETYNEICRNVVLPFVFSVIDGGYQNVSSSVCKNSNETIETDLLKQRDALMSRSQALLDTLDSESGYLSWERDMEGKLHSITSNLEELVNMFNLSSRYTYNFLGLPYNFDNLVRSDAAKALKLCDDLVARANGLPTAVEDMTSLITKIDPLLVLDKKIQEAYIHLKHFYSLITSGAHSTILGSQYYRPLNRNIFLSARKSLSEVREVVSSRLSSIGNFLASHVGTLTDPNRERRVRESASELKFLASLHESQLQWFMRRRGKRSDRAVSRSLDLENLAKIGG
ncbi:uncharacterized protein BXIN_2043 [Babesia sp. Xinjiang]|uniref:uncharacterized protein n=1 Tax=Babesia sp. Xinjiang TaxID=462227 RepID=UPI000A233EA6|nr:uncharacterized protein BXIN_2048 [Babesia sp. Xinjiang]XP_028870994.1 uncharacterized protein BXIN_2043 [Babesia sp. Xinjiang]ORM40525.1 hypothetical protein BXIN_2048 [Babesia sp. Xinjiang]ORM40538.1 hypothetical protein BXIN_2043 [Babesia sp. Xinjiang]